MARASKPDDTITLKAFKATFNGVSSTGELPERLKLFNWGSNKTNQGDFIVDESTLECFAANQRKLARETVQIDFNHNTVPGTEAYLADKEPRATAGYGIPVVIKGKGIFLEGVETTPSGLKAAADYKDLSPAPLVDKQGRVVALHSVALTPTGAVEGLTLSDSAQKALSAELKTLSLPTIQLKGSNKGDMANAYKLANNTTYNGMYEQHMKQIQDFLENPSNESYEQVCALLKAHMGSGKPGPLDSPRPGTDILVQTFEAKIKELQDKIESSITPLSAQVKLFNEQLENSRKAMEKTERDAIIAQASKDGKVIPLSADKITTLDVGTLKELVANIKPNVVPTKPVLNTIPLTADGKKVLKTRADAASAIEDQIRHMYGDTALKTARN